MSFSSLFTNFLGIFLISLFGGIGRGGAGPFFLLHLNSFDGFSTCDEETSVDGLEIVAVIFEQAVDVIIESSVYKLERITITYYNVKIEFNFVIIPRL